MDFEDGSCDMARWMRFEQRMGEIERERREREQREQAERLAPYLDPTSPMVLRAQRSKQRGRNEAEEEAE